jgi:hypothetical protein
MITKTNLANFWRTERIRKNDRVEPKNDNEINSQGKREALGGIWTPDLYLFGGLPDV